MIDEDRTMQLFGYVSNELSKGSNKLIIMVCDQCGKYRCGKKRFYRDLCQFCVQIGKQLGDKHWNYGNKGKLNSQYGISRSNKTKQKISNNHADFKGKKNPNYGNNNLIGSNNPNWKGGIAGVRTHLMNESACIKLNTKIEGFEGHHILSNIIIYLPKYIHRSIWHDLKNNKNMKEINKLALSYLIISLHP